MTTLSRLILALLFSLTIVLYIPHLNNFSFQKVSDGLVDSNAYPHAYHLIQNNLLSHHSLSQNPELKQAFNQAITPQYIQGKTEAALTSSSQWITGQTKQPPIIDFSDLRQLLSQHYPESQRLDQALQDLAQSSEQLDSLPQVTADPTLQASLNTIINQQDTLNALAQGNAEIHLQPILEPFKIAYQGYRILLFILPALLLLGLLLPLLLSKSPLRHKQYRLGRQLIWVSIFTAAILIPFYLIVNGLIIPSLQTAFTSQQPLISSIFMAIWQPLSHHSLYFILITPLAGLILGFTLTLLTKPPKPSTPTSSLPTPPHQKGLE